MAGRNELTPPNLDADLAEIEGTLRALTPRSRAAKSDLSPRARLRWMLAGRATLAAGVAIPLLAHVSPRPTSATKRTPPALGEEAAAPIPAVPVFVRDAHKFAAGPSGLAGKLSSTLPEETERPELATTGSISTTHRTVAER